MTDTVADRGVSVYDVRITPSTLFPLAVQPDLMIAKALAAARLRQRVKTQIREIVDRDTMRRALECLYWFVFSKQFFEKTTVEVQELLRKQLATYYLQLLVSRMDMAKEDSLHYIPVIFTYAICTDLYHRFPNSRSALNSAFILTVARLIHSTLFGLETSDVYIRQKLASLYNSRIFGLDVTVKTNLDTDERKVSNTVIMKMKEVNGGVEFAKELYKLGEYRSKQQNSKLPQEEMKTVSVSEAKLEKVVRSYAAQRATSAGCIRRLQAFDCSSLSPLLANQLSCTSVRLT